MIFYEKDGKGLPNNKYDVYRGMQESDRISQCEISKYLDNKYVSDVRVLEGDNESDISSDNTTVKEQITNYDMNSPDIKEGGVIADTKD